MTDAVKWVEADVLDPGAPALLGAPFDTVLDSGMLVRGYCGWGGGWGWARGVGGGALKKGRGRGEGAEGVVHWGCPAGRKVCPPHVPPPCHALCHSTPGPTTWRPPAPRCLTRTPPPRAIPRTACRALQVCFPLEQRPAYLANLQRLVAPGGRLHIICLSERETRPGLLRLSRDELRALFEPPAFELVSVEDTVYEQHPAAPQYASYLATFLRGPGAAPPAQREPGPVMINGVSTEKA